MIAKTYSISWVIVLLAVSPNFAVTVNTFDDITFWTGAGENNAAIVIDWDHTSAHDEALVWGYRWTGAASGEDMLRAVVEADPRLFLKQGTPGALGLPVYGIGYDLNNDSAFAITDGSAFDAKGFVESGVPDPVPQLPATSVETADNYAEGFFTGFWHYAINDGNPFADGNWLGSLAGLSSRQLADGDWDGWTFETPPTLISTAFPENSRTAEAPLFADFDTDHDIDGADLLAWQRGSGISDNAMRADGDANGDGRVDQLDLQAWSDAYGNLSAVASVQAIPEPTSLWIFVAGFMFMSLGNRVIHPRRTPRRCF